MTKENRQNDGEKIELTRGELDELVTRAAQEAVRAESERRKRESVVDLGKIDVSARLKKEAYDPKVREEIRHRREALGLSLVDLGRMAHVAPGNIEEIEGNGIISGYVLGRVRNALSAAENGR